MKQISTLMCGALMASMLFVACAKNGNQAATPAVDSAKMTAEANKAKMKEFYDNVINAHNADKISDYATASFVDHNPDPGHDGNGIENNKKSFQEWFAMMPDAHVTVDNMVADGDMVWAMVTMTGTMKGDMGPMKATNKSCKIGGVDIVRIKDGKAVERWGYFDNMAMMQQLGLMPSMPAAPPANAKKM